MAQSISPLSAAIPLSSDCSTFISKPKPQLPPTSLNSRKPKSGQNAFGRILSMATGRNVEHIQRASSPQPKRRPEPAPSGSWDRFPTTRTVIMDPLSYSYTTSNQPPISQTQNGSYSRGRTPWEIMERESEYKVRFDMPGMTKNDVKVWVEENMLIVQAEKTPKKKINQADDRKADVSNNIPKPNGVEAREDEEEEEEWPAKSFGEYRSMIALPENLQLEKIKAEVRDGVLYITIPKAIVSAKVLDIAVQ